MLPKFHHVQQLLLPLGAVQGPIIVRQWNQGPGGAHLRSPDAQVTSIALVDAYKYPYLSSAINRTRGAQL
jgi:hypothetical protein